MFYLSTLVRCVFCVSLHITREIMREPISTATLSPISHPTGCICYSRSPTQTVPCPYNKNIGQVVESVQIRGRNGGAGGPVSQLQGLHAVLLAPASRVSFVLRFFDSLEEWWSIQAQSQQGCGRNQMMALGPRDSPLPIVGT